MSQANYNPDVLTCLANLSNDEVFTPPSVANRMLDLLPQELFSSADTRFLDPVCKSGVFLREIAKRLMSGLAEQIPDVQERVNHIFTRQLYGIAITELTSLLSRRSVYCSKHANGEYSACTAFTDEQGNIRYDHCTHDWQGGRCRYCGASREIYERGDERETYAYQFIHTNNPQEIFHDMKFDVIIGNPPYQLSDGGAQASAMPIYHKFVEQAKKLQPRYLVMIIPSRWFSGGRGLDEFRKNMIEDTRIRILYDYYNASDCFGNGVEIKGGVCFFLWNRDSQGMCKIYSHSGIIISESNRYLQEKNNDVFIRSNEGVSIYRKISQKSEPSFATYVSSQKPFGLRTFIKGQKQSFDGCIKLYERNGIGYISPSMVEQNQNWISQYKILLSRAYNAGDTYPHQIIGKPILSEPNSACTETYVVIGPFESKTIAINVMSYIRTKLFRFLVFLRKTSQMASNSVYQFVPIQDFSVTWTDEKLYAKYGLSEKEINFVESMIKTME